METASVVRVYGAKFDNYFKAWLFRIVVQCPYYKCRKLNKHGHASKTCSPVEFSGFRSCDYCGKEYKFSFSS